MNEGLLRNAYTHTFTIYQCVVHRFLEYTIHRDHSLYIVLTHFNRFYDFKYISVPTIYTCYSWSWENFLCRVLCENIKISKYILYINILYSMTFKMFFPFISPYLLYISKDKNDIKWVSVCVCVKIRKLQESIKWMINDNDNDHDDNDVDYTETATKKKKTIDWEWKCHETLRFSRNIKILLILSGEISH